MSTSTPYDLVIIGGGAAGFFCAIQCAERRPDMRIVILEKSTKTLSKVKVSGGGRCNVTHGCFDPRDMVEHYPRGKKELLGPFHRFLCGDMMGWLDDHGIKTKIESDGRVFPVSNSSQEIIDCFLKLCASNNIEIKTQHSVRGIEKKENHWHIKTKEDEYTAEHVLVATGSSPAFWEILKAMGHTIIPPVPSLFTFNIKSKLIQDLPGISVPWAEVNLVDFPFMDAGPLLITHWGLSGPAILKLSAWAARHLHEVDYKFNIEINWVNQELETIKSTINATRAENGKQLLAAYPLFNLPKRLWANMIFHIGIHKKNFASLTSHDISSLVEILGKCPFDVDGKSTFKAEFVTCGGIDTKEINFKTMASKLNQRLFFAGEVINIDAITGGFNFQAAWTEAFIAAEAITAETPVTYSP